jgi:hypothetical protein
MASDEDRKVIEFMEKHYPQYKDNLALGRLLYAKHLGKVARAAITNEFTRVKIKDIGVEMVGHNVEVVGLLGSVERYVFKVCPVCRHKKCLCKNPISEGRYEDLIRLRMVVGDESGVIDVLLFRRPDEFHEFEVGKEVVVKGRVKFFYDDERSNRLEIAASDVSYLERQNNGVDDSGLGVVVDFVRKAKKVRRDIVEKMCEKHGVRIEDVLKVFNEVDGYVVA